jgi:hypothetical protein
MKPSERNSEKGKEYSRWTSAAIAALFRAEKFGISEEVQRLSLSSAEKYTDVHNLWPIRKDRSSDGKSEREGYTPPTGDRGSGDGSQAKPDSVPVPKPESEDGEIVESYSTILTKRKAEEPTGPPPTAEMQGVTSSAKDHLRALLTGDVGRYFCQSKRCYSWVTKKFVLTTTSGDEEGRKLPEIPESDLDPLLNSEMVSEPFELEELAKAFSSGEKRNFVGLSPYLRRRPVDNKVVIYRVPIRGASGGPSKRRKK